MIYVIPAQLSPKNPAKQVQVPVNVSHVPWVDMVQSSGQVKPKKTIKHHNMIEVELGIKIIKQMA